MILYVRGSLSDHILATLRFIPLDEILTEDRKLISTSIPNDGEEREASLSTDSSFSTLNAAGGGICLFVNHMPDESDEPETSLILVEPSDKLATKSFTLTSREGGSYVISLSLTKELESRAEGGLHVVSPRVWDFAHRRNHYLLARPQEHLAPQEASEISVTKSQVEQSSQVITTDSFSEYSNGNNVQVLIDGLETFEMMYEALMSAQHTISILAWELSLSFGLVLTNTARVPPPPLTPPSSKWIPLEVRQ